MAMKMQEELGDDVTILLVESQGHPADEVEKFIYGKKWVNDRSLWTVERPFETGATGIPNYALLSNDGEVLSMGNPGSDHSKIVDLINEQLKNAKKGAKGTAPSCVKAGVEFDKGNFVAAIKSLDAAPEAEKAAAEKLKHSLETRAHAKVARLDWYIDAAEFDKADKLLGVLQKGVTGDEKLESAVKASADKLADKEMAQEREAGKAFAKIEKLITGGGLDDIAVKQLKALSAKYPKTRAAKRADHLVAIAAVAAS
jgi:ribosomal protein L18E